MSFMLTTDQVRNRTKTVTRRTGWADLKPGTLLRAVVKCQGLRKSERMEPLAVICVISVRHERLCEMTGPYGAVEVVREGFPGMAPADFVEMFSASHGDCGREAVLTRIEFRYVPGGRLETSSHEQARQHIIDRCTKIVTDSEQMIRDALYWNDYVRAVKWPEMPPIDVEPCRVTVSKAKEIRKLAEDEKPIPDELWNDLIRAAEEPLM